MVTCSFGTHVLHYIVLWLGMKTVKPSNGSVGSFIFSTIFASMKNICSSYIYQNWISLSQYHTLASNSVIARHCWKYCHSCFVRWGLILFLFFLFSCCLICLLLIWNVLFFIHTPLILIIIRKYFYALSFSFSTFMPQCPWLEACKAQSFPSKFIPILSFFLILFIFISFPNILIRCILFPRISFKFEDRLGRKSCSREHILKVSSQAHRII